MDQTAITVDAIAPGHPKQSYSYLHYGCGMVAPETWLNFDASATLWFERLPLLGRIYTKNQTRFPANVRYGDIVRGLPLAANSCQGAYCSHMLHLLTLEEFERCLENTHRYLRPGGIFRFVFGDLELMIRAYLANSNPTASVQLMRHLDLGKERRPRTVLEHLRGRFSRLEVCWMWDEKGVRHQLESHGFTAVRRVQFGDYADPRFADVERKEYFDSFTLAMECAK